MKPYKHTSNITNPLYKTTNPLYKNVIGINSSQGTANSLKICNYNQIIKIIKGCEKKNKCFCLLQMSKCVILRSSTVKVVPLPNTIFWVPECTQWKHTTKMNPLIFFLNRTGILDISILNIVCENDWWPCLACSCISKS